MRLAIAVAVTLAFPAAGQVQPQPYHALGTEPFWSLTIDGDTIRYRPAEGSGITVAKPRALPSPNGEHYRTPALTVLIAHIRCSDGMSDRIYRDTVTLRVGNIIRKGCGGDDGASDRPRIDGDWTIQAIDGRPAVASSDPHLSIRQDRLTGTTGCNRFSGSVRFVRGHLTAGPLATSRRACIGKGIAAQERRLLAVLSQRLSVTSNPAGKLVLTSAQGGTLTLAPR